MCRFQNFSLFFGLLLLFFFLRLLKCRETRAKSTANRQLRPVYPLLHPVVAHPPPTLRPTPLPLVTLHSHILGKINANSPTMVHLAPTAHP